PWIYWSSGCQNSPVTSIAISWSFAAPARAAPAPAPCWSALVLLGSPIWRTGCWRGRIAACPSRDDPSLMMPEPSPRLQPPSTKGHLSVARLSNYWYFACRSRELGRRPLACTVLGTPLVLFRAAGSKPAALLDRCPHRNAPLSIGRLVGDGRL